jgi:hypothetical protein
MASDSPKIDNGALGTKLALRRHFLRRFHAAQPPRVFDACQATGVLWSRLRAEFPVASYWGVDLTPKRGRLTIDSTRVLAQPGWDFDVVDIDTYGSPWAHWAALLPNLRAPATVFLTIGTTQYSGSVCAAARDVLGLGGFAARGVRLPISFGRKLSALAVDYCLALTYTYRVRVVRAVEAPPAGSARYFGLHIEPEQREG